MMTIRPPRSTPAGRAKPSTMTPSRASRSSGASSRPRGSASWSTSTARKFGRRGHRAKAVARTGRAPRTVRWIDTDKCDDDTPSYRSRLVAREIHRHGESPIFALTPPLESLRIVFLLVATDIDGREPRCRDPKSEDRTQVLFIDICRAYSAPSQTRLSPQTWSCFGRIPTLASWWAYS